MPLRESRARQARCTAGKIMSSQMPAASLDSEEEESRPLAARQAATKRKAPEPPVAAAAAAAVEHLQESEDEDRPISKRVVAPRTARERGQSRRRPGSSLTRPRT